MLAAVVVLLLAVVAGSITSGLAPLLGFAGLLLFIVGYAMFFIKPPKTEKRWRGQPIEYDDSLWSRLRRRLGRSNG
jgi:ABC-type nickel/cobalt efflux system permease component RcnA